jgi:heat shock protein HslJ
MLPMTRSLARTRLTVQGGAAVTALLLLASCGTDGDAGAVADRSATPGTSIAPTAAPSPLRDRADVLELDPSTAPADFLTRTPLPSCGAYLVPPIEMLPADASQCVADALGTPHGAELASQVTTVEGDAVVTYLRILPGTAGIEVFDDSTRDQFGTKIWTRAACTGLDAATARPTACTQNAAYLNGDIAGRWLPREIDDFTFTTAMSDRAQFAIELRADGTWSGSDGCNALGGTYTADQRGAFRATAGPHTEVGCENVPTDRVLTAATSVVLQTDHLRFLGPPGAHASEQILADYVRMR